MSLPVTSNSDPDRITLIWHVDDVLEIRPDLTRDQARTVLRLAEEQHDANFGINWDTLQTVADIEYPSAKG